MCVCARARITHAHSSLCVCERALTSGLPAESAEKVKKQPTLAETPNSQRSYVVRSVADQGGGAWGEYGDHLLCSSPDDTNEWMVTSEHEACHQLLPETITLGDNMHDDDTNMEETPSPDESGKDDDAGSSFLREDASPLF